MNTRIITGEIQAWLPDHCNGQSLEKGRDPIAALSEISYTTIDMAIAGWTRLGMATISVEVPDGNELKLAKVTALRAEIRKTRADAEEKCTHLERTINNLLAIEYEPAADEVVL